MKIAVGKFTPLMLIFLFYYSSVNSQNSLNVYGNKSTLSLRVIRHISHIYMYKYLSLLKKGIN